MGLQQLRNALQLDRQVAHDAFVAVRRWAPAARTQREQIQHGHLHAEYALVLATAISGPA